jgi:hypothetical protein
MTCLLTTLRVLSPSIVMFFILRTGTWAVVLPVRHTYCGHPLPCNTSALPAWISRLRHSQGTSVHIPLLRFPGRSLLRLYLCQLMW